MRRTRALFVVSTFAAICCAVWCLPLESWTLGFTAWLRTAGWLGVLLYLVVFVLGSLVFLPGLPMVLAAGFAYGPFVGFVVALPAATAAAASTFLMGRHLGKDWVERRLHARPRWRALHRATEHQGFRLVVLLRLSPLVPFTLLGYVMGISRISFRDFLVASTLGKLPGLALYVYLASVVSQVSELKRTTASTAGELLYWGGLLVTLLLVWQLGRFAQHKAQSLLTHIESGAP